MGIIEMIMPVGYPVSGDYILNQSIIRKISLFSIVRSLKRSLWISQISNLGLNSKYIDNIILLNLPVSSFVKYLVRFL